MFRAFLVNLVKENTIRVYKFEKRADGLPTNVKSVLDFPKVNKHTRTNSCFHDISFRKMKAT